MKRWTKEEIKMLKDNYVNKSKQDLLILLNDRTWIAIKRKARLLKLTWLTPEQRFWKKVDKKSDNECWNWTGSCFKFGYGQIRIKNKMIKAHRFSWEIHFGKIPDDKPCVLHHCDNPKCVNPSHLWSGTYKDNTKDMINKDRANKAKGENIGTSKLTENQVKQIKLLYSQKKLTQVQISKIFNVSRETISHIYTNKIWRHI